MIKVFLHSSSRPTTQGDNIGVSVGSHVVVKKTVHGRNRSTKAWEPALHTRGRQEVPKDELGTYEDPRWVDSVGMQLMPNGPLTGYKRRRSTKKRSSRVERTKYCRTDSELLSLLVFSVFCSIAYLCRFRGGSRCSWNAPSASCSTSNLLFCFCASQQAGIGICSPPCPFTLVSLSCPTVGCNIWLCC